MQTGTTLSTSAATSADGGARPARRESVFAAALAAVFGAIILWVVGFSPIEVLHDASHDVRHSSGFPCH